MLSPCEMPHITSFKAQKGIKKTIVRQVKNSQNINNQLITHTRLLTRFSAPFQPNANYFSQGEASRGIRILT